MKEKVMEADSISSRYMSEKSQWHMRTEDEDETLTLFNYEMYYTSSHEEASAVSGSGKIRCHFKIRCEGFVRMHIVEMNLKHPGAGERASSHEPEALYLTQKVVHGAIIGPQT